MAMKIAKNGAISGKENPMEALPFFAKMGDEIAVFCRLEGSGWFPGPKVESDIFSVKIESYSGFRAYVNPFGRAVSHHHF